MDNFLNIKSIIIDNEELNAVNSRDLYYLINVDKKHYLRWIETNLLNGLFEEGKDYIVTSRNTTDIGGRPSIDYIITLDTAKELAMMTRSQKGKEIRKYFIECEKKINELKFIDKINEIINIPDIDKQQKEGFVYLIKCDDSYKIGVSKEPYDRLKTLQTGTAKKLDLIYYKKFDDCYKVEKYLHKTFNDKRLIGEWFNLNNKDIEFIKNYK